MLNVWGVVGTIQLLADIHRQQTSLVIERESANTVWIPASQVEAALKAGLLEEGQYFIDNSYIWEGGQPHLMQIVDGKAVSTGHTYSKHDGAFVQHKDWPDIM